MFCHHCGAQVSDAAQFCTNCGQPLTAAASVSTAPVAWTPPTRVQVTAGRWIGQGWDLVKADLGTYILIALLYSLLGSVPLINGALIAGFHIFTMKKLMGRNAELGDLFQGFNFFLQALLASIVIAAFVFLGTLCLIIPGLIIAAMYKFTFLFIVDKRMDFWQAMKAGPVLADHALACRLERAEGMAGANFVEAQARAAPQLGAQWIEVAGV